MLTATDTPHAYTEGDGRPFQPGRGGRRRGPKTLGPAHLADVCTHYLGALAEAAAGRGAVHPASALVDPSLSVHPSLRNSLGTKRADPTPSLGPACSRWPLSSRTSRRDGTLSPGGDGCHTAWGCSREAPDMRRASPSISWAPLDSDGGSSPTCRGRETPFGVLHPFPRGGGNRRTPPTSRCSDRWCV